MGAKPAPPLPEPQPVTRMPDPKNAEALAMKDEKQRKLLSQAGRESTLLSDDVNTTLGG